MRRIRILPILALLTAYGCSSSNDGANGAAGPTGSAGPQGPAGPAGPTADAAAPAPAALDLVPSLAIPGADFYPQSIYAAEDGTLFVGGIGGSVVRFDPTSTKAVPIASKLGVIPGLTVDDSTKSVFVCGNAFAPPPPPPGGHVNPFQNPTGTLYQLGFDGQVKKQYPFPAADKGKSICEDLVFDAKHDLYMTDAFAGSIFKLPKGGDAIAKWTSDPLLVASAPDPHVPGFGAHGITPDGSGNLYVSNFHDSTLIRVPIQADGSAGKAVLQKIEASPGSLAPAYAQPEGVHALDATHLVGTMGSWGKPGYLVQLTQTGPDAWTSSVLKNNLQGPTSVAKTKTSYFVVEGQAEPLVDFLIGATDQPPNPNLPFLVQRLTTE